MVAFTEGKCYTFNRVVPKIRNGGKTMALVKFPECGHDVSSDAQTCPNCGKPVDATAQNSYPESKQKERNNKSTTIFIAVLCLFFACSVIVGIWQSTAQSSSGKNAADNYYSSNGGSSSYSKPSYSSRSSFTNKFGTATTICNHSGCTNYIASSGDTNCCTKHSNRCLSCKCYIDEDAMFCISCLAKAAGQQVP